MVGAGSPVVRALDVSPRHAADDISPAFVAIHRVNGGAEPPVTLGRVEPKNPRVVLSVDDDASIRLLCRVNLELDGFEVREAATLDAARAEIEAGEVDVVLLDMHVAGEHALGLMEELAGRIPVAAVSGSADLDSGRYAIADALVTKPFEIDDLRRVVAELAARSR